MSARSERQVEALRLAQACSELGARARTINHVTGLPTRELQRLFFADTRRAPRGRAPDSAEWYHAANLLKRAEASIFVSIYRRLRSDGFQAAGSLVTAYRQYRSVCQLPYRISFDRAFDLASHLDGIWVARGAALCVVRCPCCGSDYLAPPGDNASAQKRCPFCCLMQRYACDKRLQASFPRKPLRDAAALQPTVTAMLHGRPRRLRPDGESASNVTPFLAEGRPTVQRNGTCSP